MASFRREYRVENGCGDQSTGAGVSPHRRRQGPAQGKRMSVTNVLSRALFLAVLASRARVALAGIFPYDDMELEYSQLIYRESGMFAPGKGFLEIGAGVGDGESFIRLTELEFEAYGTGLCVPDAEGSFGANCERQTGHVELAIFEQKSFEHVGVVIDERRYYCCNDEAMESGACFSDQMGTMLLSDTKDIWWHKTLDLEPGVPVSLDHQELYRVAETGMYVVLVGNCEPKTGPIFINGHSEWKNPYGYLPGEEYGCLPFFFGLAAVYLSLGIVWLVVCMAYIKDLLAIQMWTSVVVFLGMVETGAQYFDYRDWNLEGARGPGAQSFAIIFGAAKRSLSLSLVLMVCMGYGVVRQSLGRDVHKIMAMALVYFISSALWVAFTSNAAQDRDFATRASVNAAAILVFVNAAIMVVFYMWIIQSIIGVIQHLRDRSQTAKLALFVQFRRVLGASVIFAFAWATYGLVRSSEVESERHWESAWTVDAMWEVIYLAVLMSVCFLLRPSMNAQRFSYAAVPFSGGKRDEEDGGDILLQPIDDDEAEYGGFLDEGEDKVGEPAIPVPPQKGRLPKPAPKKENQD